ncbi:MAG: SCO family protein [Myxococcales bacterium FL481]|nr:MAG: SCO family protein [Myxococcales bacterium FL481]
MSSPDPRHRSPHPVPEDRGGVLGFVRRHIWAVAIAVGLVVTTGMRPFTIRRPPVPEVLFQVPNEFALVDQDGRAFTPDDLRGKAWVVGFIFTRCPSVCPRVSQVMKAIADDIHHGNLTDRVNVLSVSVDPEHDTPAVLKDYADRLGADPVHWRFVTGSPEQIERFVVDGFHLAVGDRQQTAPGVYDIAHATRLALVDQQGGVRVLFPTEDGNRAELFNQILGVVRLAHDGD